MATPQINKLIVSEGEYMSGMTDTNHLSRYLDDYAPEKFSQIMINLFMNRQLMANPLLEMTEGKNNVKYLSGESDSWTWDIDMGNYHPLIVMENMESTTATPGIDGLPFKLKLDKDWFTNGDVITPDKRNIQFRITDDPILKESDGSVYTCVLITSNPGTSFVAQKYFAVGVEYIRLYNIHGERASQFSKLHFTPSAKLMDRLPDQIRIEHEITGYADKRVLKVASASIDENGKPIKLTDGRWFRRAEIEFWKEFYQQVDRSLMWGRGSEHIKGEGGYNIRTPQGLWERLDMGNVYNYSKFSLKLIEDFLLAIFFGRVEGKNRRVVLGTGEWGMQMFDRAIREEVSKFGLFLSSDKMITGTGMDMGYGGQFTKFYPINGGVVELRYMPSLDMDATNLEKGFGLYPATSASFIILDLSGDSGDNLQLVKHKDAEAYGYIEGTSSPFGTVRGRAVSSPKDGYSMWGQTRCGIHISDLSRTAKLVFNNSLS